MFSAMTQRARLSFIPIDAFDCAVWPVAFGRSTGQTAFNQVFVNALIRGPQVIALILPAAWRKNL